MDSKDDELIIMVKTKDGKHRCVPISKLKDFEESEEKRLNNSYTEEDLKKIEDVKKQLEQDFVERRKNK